jgi:DNA-binding NtrC family response regulator
MNNRPVSMAMFSQIKLSQLEAQEQRSQPVHTVMIVDDKSANLSVMAAILRPYYQVLEASDGQEALTAIEGIQHPENLACVISDHRMPRMSGVELLEKIQPLLPRTPRILVTGYIDVDAVVDSINKAGVFRFIVKPFDAEDFLATVKRAVDTFERQRAQSAAHARLIEENRQLRARNASLEAQMTGAG